MDNIKKGSDLSWDEYFMKFAEIASLRSKDPSTKMGVCIVNEDNRILSTGYNGTPNGYDDDKFPWNEKELKYAMVCHAELNAILNYKGSKKDFQNSRIYLLLCPCHECAKVIIQAGIKEVIYKSDNYANYKMINGKILAKHMFDECGVKYREL